MVLPVGVILLDGFDDYGPNGHVENIMPSLGWSIAQTMFTTGNTPHNVGQALVGTNHYGFDQSTSFRPIGGTCADLIVGCHINLGTNVAGSVKLLGFSRGNELGGFSETIWVCMNEQRGISLTNDGRTILYAASDPTIFFNETWYHFEIRLDFLTGHMTARLDEQVIIDTAMPGGVSAIGGINTFRTDGEPGPVYSETRIDNMYMLNAQGAAAPFNDFLGECIIYTGRPNGDTGPNDMAIVGAGVDHYGVVDDLYVDDADFLQTTEANDGEYFSITNLPADTIEVLAVGISTRMKKETGAPANYRAKARIGASEIVFPTRTISGSFESKYEYMNTKPGGGAWTIADANNLEIGVETLA